MAFELVKYLPEFLQEVTELQAIQTAATQEINTVQSEIAEMQKQKFIQTAEDGLLLWENEYDIPRNMQMPYEDRRKRIIAKIAGTGTSTFDLFGRLAQIYSSDTVEVFEIPQLYRFIIRFSQETPPDNIHDFINTIEEIKPAHLQYFMCFYYNTWGTIAHLTWQDVAELTWDIIRTFLG